MTAKQANAWWLLPGAAALVAVAVLDLRNDQLSSAAVDVATGLVFYLAGAIAFLARPANRAAWLLLLTGTVLAVGKAIGSALSPLSATHGSSNVLWAGIVVANAAAWGVSTAGVSVFATFPDGKFQRRYEQRVVVGLVLAFIPVQLCALLGAAHVSSGQFGSGPIAAASPIYIHGLDPVGAFGQAVLDVSNVAVALGLALLIARYRRFGQEQRRQIRWPLYAVVLSGLSLMFVFFGPGPPSIPFWVAALQYLATVSLLPIGLALGIVVHRGVDIDDVIRRSVVYGALWALIAAAYVLLAAGLGIAVGQRVPLALAIALTILATLVFQPARRELEKVADRLVFGPRLSGYELISRLGARLESSPGAEDVAGTVATAVKTGLGAQWVRLVLDRPEPTVVASVGDRRSDAAAPELRVPLSHGAEMIGVIECGPKEEGRYTRSDEDLLMSLGRQAALAIRNSDLTSELSARLSELEASRARLVEAEEAGRRRLERDLHDGVQQELVGLLARLGLARSQLARGSDRTETTVHEALDDARRALESLQELARGIHPTLLTDHGLIEAVEERASRMPIPVQVSSDGVPRDTRFAAPIEGAGYFFISEALTNAIKHANASRVDIGLRRDDAGRLLIEVSDDGGGFNPATAQLSGLRGLEDRIEALGGCMEVTSGDGGGTRLVAWLPLGETAHA